MWKTVDGNYLNDLYQQIGDEARESEEPEASVDVPTEDASL
jgi:hypothetical protein